MTRKERALKNLKQMCSDGRYLGSGSHVPLEVLEDFDLAIKALEQEPTIKNDCETCIHNKGVLECDMYGCKYEPTTKDEHHRQNIQAYAHDFGVSEEQAEKELRVTTKNNIPHCQCTDAEIAKSFIEDVEVVKDQLPCGEQMDFPSTFDEFAKDYGFKDKDEIYTNGSELIPVFRVKQWLEHISTTTNDLAVDCISRADVDAVIEQMRVKLKDGRMYILAEVVQDIIRELPSVTPPKIVSIAENKCDIDKLKELMNKTPLTTVTPQEPKTGHWIKYGRPRCGEQHYKCTNCDEYFNFGLYSDYYKKAFKFCPHCGCAMVEPQESENKE